MHELALCEGIIDIVNSEAKENKFERVLEIELKVGEYSGIVSQCIREFFPVAAAGTPAENAELTISVIPGSFKCPECGYEGPVDRRKACCPDCGGYGIKMVSGREFFVEQLKVE